MRKAEKIFVSVVRKITDNLRSSTRSPDKLHQYWKNLDDPNVFQDYIKPVERSKFLLGLVESLPLEKAIQLEKAIHILELGCNVGRNLDYLFSAGYKNLTGVEINPAVIQLMRRVYPEMADQARIIEGLIEETTTSFKDKEFDLVFTMGTLQHIHPANIRFVCDEISRITKKFLITIENETPTMSSNKFARNYKKIFESLEFEQISEIADIPVETELGGYTARIFRHTSESKIIRKPSKLRKFTKDSVGILLGENIRKAEGNRYSIREGCSDGEN